MNKTFYIILLLLIINTSVFATNITVNDTYINNTYINDTQINNTNIITEEQKIAEEQRIAEEKKAAAEKKAADTEKMNTTVINVIPPLVIGSLILVTLIVLLISYFKHILKKLKIKKETPMLPKELDEEYNKAIKDIGGSK